MESRESVTTLPCSSEVAFCMAAASARPEEHNSSTSKQFMGASIVESRIDGTSERNDMTPEIPGNVVLTSRKKELSEYHHCRRKCSLSCSVTHLSCFRCFSGSRHVRVQAQRTSARDRRRFVCQHSQVIPGSKFRCVDAGHAFAPILRSPPFGPRLV